WRDKGSNLREVASELRLDLDALVLLDDNPVERALIDDILPQVEVCPASDPLEMLRWLTTCRRFDTLAITTEAALRAKSPAASALRREMVSDVDDLEGYLTGLRTEVQVG